MIDKTDNEFAQRLKTTLRQSEQQVDTRTRARLAAARREALQETGSQKHAVWQFGRNTPAWGALAAAAIVAVVVLRTGTTPETAPVITASTDTVNETLPIEQEQELELYENLELLEFYEELEFYEWLAEEVPEEVAS